jgi:hypothetical protein
MQIFKNAGSEKVRSAVEGSDNICPPPPLPREKAMVTGSAAAAAEAVAVA